MSDLRDKTHFVGVAGSGMSALAQYHAMGGGAASGSDRAFDQGAAEEVSEKLRALGIELYPQDGSALSGRPSRIVSSTAVEAEIPDIREAVRAGLPVIHRADYLAEQVASHRAIAVAGTSGKSTVVSMIFEILESAGLSPSVITGGALLSLRRRGLLGNAFKGKSDILVVEADESDGTVVRYKPFLGVLLNISKDHKSVQEIWTMFESFCRNSVSRVVNADAVEFQEFLQDSKGFGFGAGESRAQSLRLFPDRSEFSVSGVSFSLPVPGRYNVENALAAVAACAEMGVSLEAASQALARFQGVARRFERVGQARDVEVIDDFAHNPAKVLAALAAAHLRSPRVHAVFQLHGFSPARFLREEFISAFVSGLAPQDTLWLPEIYYAGGTAAKNISARDYASDLQARGVNARFFDNRLSMLPELLMQARPGDLILVMGARDPGLPKFAREILRGLSS